MCFDITVSSRRVGDSDTADPRWIYHKAYFLHFVSLLITPHHAQMQWRYLLHV